ncbi:ABC transporter substrate-binding protein [Nonomuraea sp. NN258]|uniref:ABC transporter substrate-binding protein n=1 Tax=Nonomuraea antri TaxID=2730852 RepID=UPI001568778D|nr:ABC transporter substrate-binding protein [Nonomuraea antri]NRQ35008.1 ABC transporter substrate-binding protein [Nonomuraea antri]
MRYGTRGTLIGLIASLTLTLALTACSGGGGDRNTSAGGSEKTTISVGMLPVPDAAPLYIAINKGYFAAEGLTVKPELMAQGTAAALTKQAGGGLDVILGNYMSVFTAQEKGVGTFTFIADCYQAGADGFNLMVKSDSPLKSPAELKGRTIALNSIGNIGDLAVISTIKGHGLTRDDVTFVEIPFPEMAKALAEKRVDAAWLAEPFITYAEKQNAARTLADTMTGPTKDFPVAGWSVTAEFAKANPGTVAAFQRAIGKAQAEAAGDRDEVTKVVPTYTKIDAQSAAAISLGTFPTAKLDGARLQRVADLMRELGFLTAGLDAKTMVAGQTR